VSNSSMGAMEVPPKRRILGSISDYCDIKYRQFKLDTVDSVSVSSIGDFLKRPCSKLSLSSLRYTLQQPRVSMKFITQKELNLIDYRKLV
jgi:hypothetical protein